jgi:hypothetical protein
VPASKLGFGDSNVNKTDLAVKECIVGKGGKKIKQLEGTKEIA